MSKIREFMRESLAFEKVYRQAYREYRRYPDRKVRELAVAVRELARKELKHRKWLRKRLKKYERSGR